MSPGAGEGAGPVVIVRWHAAGRRAQQSKHWVWVGEGGGVGVGVNVEVAGGVWLGVREGVWVKVGVKGLEGVGEGVAVGQAMTKVLETRAEVRPSVAQAMA